MGYIAMINVTAKDKPKWYQLRWKLSNLFVEIGRRIYPENPEVMAFYMQMMSDQMIYGNAITRIDPEKLFNPDDYKL